MGAHYIPPPAASAGDLLWQLIGGIAPANIELNTTNGAAGIVAPLPGNTAFTLRLNLQDVANFPFAGLGFDNATGFIRVGIIDDGDPKALITSQNAITGDSRAITVDFAGNMAIEFENGAGDSKTELELQPDGTFKAEWNNPTTNDRSVIQINPATNDITLSNYVAGGLQTQFAVDSNNIRVSDGTPTAVFRVTNTGAIQTNQAAATGGHATETNEIEVFDLAGASVGFLKLYT